MPLLRLEALSRRWRPLVFRDVEWPDTGIVHDRRVSENAIQVGAWLVAALSGLSVLLQIGLTAFSGTGSAIARVAQLLGKFPVESALLVCVAAVVVARRPHGLGAACGALLHAALVGASVTFLVYVVAMRSIPTPGGFWWSAAAAGLHYVVPVLAILGWLVVGPRGALGWTTAVLALAWPLVWGAVVLAQGAATGFYPYPFVDVDRFGYSTVTGNCLAVVGLLAVVSGVFAVVERMHGAQR